MGSHLQHTEEILYALANANVTIKLTKCAFFTQKVRYFRQIIELCKLSIDVTTFKELKEENTPRDQQELCSFLGLCNVYRSFIRGLKIYLHH